MWRRSVEKFPTSLQLLYWQPHVVIILFRSRENLLNPIKAVSLSKCIYDTAWGQIYQPCTGNVYQYTFHALILK